MLGAGSASPLALCIGVTGGAIAISGVVMFNVLLARLFTILGALVLNLGLFWLLLRLVVRALVFPGSIVLWKRSTEATYRVQMSQQFGHHIEHLHAFLVQLTDRKPGPLTGINAEGVLLGCTVIEGLSRNFRLQQRDQVRFTTEQAQLRLLVQGVENWISEAKVRERGEPRGGVERGARGEQQVPLLDWMQTMSQSTLTVPLSSAVSGVELAPGPEAGPCIERLEQLLGILDELQAPQGTCCGTARRFLRVPTVGSLHQLRAELQARYSGRHCWVRVPGGRKIDAMLITCQATQVADRSALLGGVGSPAAEEALAAAAAAAAKDDGTEAPERDDSNLPLSREEIPLKDAHEKNDFDGSFVVWCNPNAGYYETMVYESQWLDLYLAQGCHVFLFNYSGFGRSTGIPSPGALAADGDAVVDYLRRRGVTKVAVHGRSIGGIAACHLAQKHPGIVKVLIADRTFSSLARVTKYLLGNWAVKGLSLSATWADNVDNYSKARCYKVLICDPEDATIPDLSSLRTGTAMATLDQLPPSDKLVLDDRRLQKFADAYMFLNRLVGIVEASLGDSSSSERPSPPPESNRAAREPVIGSPDVEPDVRIEIGEDDTQQLVGSRSRSEVQESPVNEQWLEEHKGLVQATVAPHAELKAIRYILTLVGKELNAAGMTLDDALGRSPGDLKFAIRAFLANIQVWGSLANTRTLPCPPADKDIESFMANSRHEREYMHAVRAESPFAQQHYAGLTPERLSIYHRQLSRVLVAQLRREFRQKFSKIRGVLEPLSCDDALSASRLSAAILRSVREVGCFISSINYFFRRIDLATDGASSDDTQASDSDGEDCDNPQFLQPMPNFDRALTGYLLCVGCGHNSFLGRGEVQHLALHLRAIGFGRFSKTDNAGGA